MPQAPLDWLFSLAQFGIKFGLDNIRAVLAELGHPERAFPSVHVAGTNGKGSVSAMVECALRLAGHRTGRYTSPHLLDLRERFAIDGEPVTQDRMLASVVRVQEAVDRLHARGTLEVHPTFFEITTAVAFDLFREARVDVAVCEVGLGGRLDATNVLSPVACAITSIGFDHQQYLGDTLGRIAAEKGGIIKRHTPVIVGAMTDEAHVPIAHLAAALDAPIVDAWSGTRAGEAHAVQGGGQSFVLRTPVRDYGTVQLALDGAHQVGNACVAVRLLEVLDERGIAVGADAITRALAQVRWPGRMERVQVGSREALLDAAHNADGADVLARHLRTLGERRPLVFAAMRDKDVPVMLTTLLPCVSRLVVTRASNPRSADPSDLATLARSIAPGLAIDTAETPRAALELAWSHAPRIAVAGSIFLLADVMKELGRS